jgi:hypothetical protein
MVVGSERRHWGASFLDLGWFISYPETFSYGKANV